VWHPSTARASASTLVIAFFFPVLVTPLEGQSKIPYTTTAPFLIGQRLASPLPRLQDFGAESMSPQSWSFKTPGRVYLEVSAVTIVFRFWPGEIDERIIKLIFDLASSANAHRHARKLEADKIALAVAKNHVRIDFPTF